MCTPVVPAKGLSEFYLFHNGDGSHWLVGEYQALTRFATALREREDLRDFLTEHQVRIGCRKEDRPPAEERQPRYGTAIPGRNAERNFSAERVKPIAAPAKPGLPPPGNRRTDRHENVKQCWQTQTPQSHHIVEFNNLETIGVSTKSGSSKMDYQYLPAVLLAAEFHQRYITSVLKPAQRWGKQKLQSSMAQLYRELYLQRHALLGPLWLVPECILEDARVLA